MKLFSAPGLAWFVLKKLPKKCALRFARPPIVCYKIAIWSLSAIPSYGYGSMWLKNLTTSYSLDEILCSPWAPLVSKSCLENVFPNLLDTQRFARNCCLKSGHPPHNYDSLTLNHHYTLNHWQNPALLVFPNSWQIFTLKMYSQIPLNLLLLFAISRQSFSTFSAFFFNGTPKCTDVHLWGVQIQRCALM